MKTFAYVKKYTDSTIELAQSLLTAPELAPDNLVAVCGKAIAKTIARWTNEIDEGELSPAQLAQKADYVVAMGIISTDFDAAF